MNNSENNNNFVFITESNLDSLSTSSLSSLNNIESEISISNKDKSSVSYEYINNNIFENTNTDSRIYNIYFNNKIRDDIIFNETSDDDVLLQNIYKNNHNNVLNLFNYRQYRLYKNSTRLCFNDQCYKCSKKCKQNHVFKSMNMFNMGIKTLYYNLFKLLLCEHKFRKYCKCCENKSKSEYYAQLNNGIVINDYGLNPKEILEIKINYYINSFMNDMTFLSCQCEHKNLYDVYDQNYLEFYRTSILFNKYINPLVPLIKKYYDLTNINDIILYTENERCIHNDTKFYKNIVYCVKNVIHVINKEYHIASITKQIVLLHEWITNNIRVNKILLDEQYLEVFKYQYEKDNNLSYENIYNNSTIYQPYYLLNNIILDIQKPYNIISIAIQKLDKNIITEKQKMFVKKLCNNQDILIILNCIYTCFKYEHYKFAIEFLKYVYIQKKDINNDIKNLLYFIFNQIINQSTITNKANDIIINKNINIINFDFIEKLVNKYENYEINIKTIQIIDLYKESDYLQNLVKNIITRKHTKIFKLLLDTALEYINFSILDIYFSVINNVKYTDEYLYVEILEYLINKRKPNISNDDINKIYELCFKNKYTLTLSTLLKTSVIPFNTTYFYNTIDYNNYTIFEIMLNKKNDLLNKKHDNLHVIQYIFNKIKNKNLIMIFMTKLIKYINKDNMHIINYQDNINIIPGFLILDSEYLNYDNKIMLFNKLLKYMDSLLVCNTKLYPIILHTCLNNYYEICSMLLLELQNKGIVQRYNTNVNNNILNYYHISNNLNINIMPIVYKFINDNYKMCKNLDNKHIPDKYFDIDNITLFLKIASYAVLFIISSSNGNEKLKNEYVYNDITTSENIDNNYKEIYNDSNNNILITDEYSNFIPNIEKCEDIWIIKNNQLESEEISSDQVSI